MVGVSDKDSLNIWINDKLSVLLDFPVPQDLTQYIISIENARDLEDYLKTLLNFSDPQHRQFYMELLQKRQIGLLDGYGYKKSETEENYIPSKQIEKKKKVKSQTNDVLQKESAKDIQGKKKSKFVNLYSPDGQARDIILLKGRHQCNCQASKHKLVNNCLKCGRIVCQQEGSGPCFFCNNLVCSQEEQQILTSGSRQADQLHQRLVEQKKPEEWESAIQHRNRLLEYDRTSERRTKVIDDESDYFTVNSVWLSKAEREKLQQREEEIQARRHASRHNRTVTLDFAGRQVLEDYGQDVYYDPDDTVLKEIQQSVIHNKGDVSVGINVHPGIMNVQPVFHNTESSHQRIMKYKETGTHKRVQDREILEMVDEGCCLSMHQPWASLLVAGIKLHEGRTWYTSHRGVLWIAAASKVPTTEEIRGAEHLYEVLKGEGSMMFPSQYPTSCLLGRVNLIDCLPQEEYRIKFPEGESDSPFVFICEDSQELPIRFPIQGKHKIYKLEPKIHQAAQKSLQRIAKLQAEQASLH